MATDHLTYLSLKNAIETAVKNGGTYKKLKTDALYDAIIEALDFAGLQRQKTIVSKAQVKACYTTPIEIKSAPGEDKVIIPVGVVCVKESGDAFSGMNAVTIVTNHGTDALITLPASGFLDQTGRVIYFSSKFDSFPAEENQNFLLKSSKDMSEAGGSDVHVYMFYRTLDLS